MLNDELQYMYALERFGIKLGLEVMEKLLAALGNPHQQFKSVHITGTNGKGSTASFIAAVLRVASYKTGLYTSPHLYRFNERIRINDMQITDQRLVELITKVRTAAEKENLQVTFFEFTTALAFLQFSQEKVDIAVVEVGMGGTLDATNVLMPEVAVITNIGLDHRPLIGTTKQEIAENKAGIIKPGISVVTAEKDPEILQLFENVALKKNAVVYSVQQQLKPLPQTSSLTEQTFTVQGSINSVLTIPLLGKHQVENACTALLAVQRLRERGWKITDKHTREGFLATKWEGRLDIVSHKPFILVDGAHNNEGAQSLHAFLTEAPLPKPEVLILAIKHGKELEYLTDRIVPLFPHVIVTEGNFEPESAPIVANRIKGKVKSIQTIPSVTDAISHGKALVSDDGMLLVAGSLYMVGDALAVLRPNTSSTFA